MFEIVVNHEKVNETIYYDVKAYEIITKAFNRVREYESEEDFDEYEMTQLIRDECNKCDEYGRKLISLCSTPDDSITLDDAIYEIVENLILHEAVYVEKVS